MNRYAEKTEVTSDRSRAEIERTLTRYGASSFAYAWEGDRAMIGFKMRGRAIRIMLQMPDRNDDEFRYTKARSYARSAEAAREAYDQACRQRWRALALLVKAKLEAVEGGIVEFEEEMLPYIMLPDGTTAGDWMRPQIAVAYETGRMPTMLPMLPPAREETGDENH